MTIEAILDYGLVVVFFLLILVFAVYFVLSPRPIDAGPEELETVEKAPTQRTHESPKNEHPVS